MRILTAILLLVALGLTTCDKAHDQTRVAFWVADSTELPVHIDIGVNNNLGTITKAHPTQPSCDECYLSVDLITGGRYDLIIYTKAKTYEREINVIGGGCQTIKLLQ